MVAHAARYAPPEDLIGIEIDLRLRWGGKEVYVRKQPADPPAPRGDDR
jgi:hypothetical protein